MKGSHMQDLSDEQLLAIYNSEKEYSILLQDGTIIHTDEEPDEETLGETKHCICHSDFGVFFELQEELKKRSLIM